MKLVRRKFHVIPSGVRLLPSPKKTLANAVNVKCSKLHTRCGHLFITEGGTNGSCSGGRTRPGCSRRKDANCASPDLHVLSADLRSSVLLNTETRCPPPPLAAARRIWPRRCGVVRSADIAARGVPPDAVHGGRVGVAAFGYEPERTRQFHLGSGSARPQSVTCSFAA